jgi:hypothetical protein
VKIQDTLFATNGISFYGLVACSEHSGGETRCRAESHRYEDKVARPGYGWHAEMIGTLPGYFGGPLNIYLDEEDPGFSRDFLVAAAAMGLSVCSASERAQFRATRNR